MTHESDLPNGPELANHLDHWLRIQSTSRDVLEGRIEKRFAVFMQDLHTNGLIRGVVVGSKKGERQGYVWMVFKEELCDLSQAADPRFKQANLLTVGLEEDLEPVLPLHIAYLNPSWLESHRKKCEELNIDTDYIEV